MSDYFSDPALDALDKEPSWEDVEHTTRRVREDIKNGTGNGGDPFYTKAIRRVWKAHEENREWDQGVLEGTHDTRIGSNGEAERV